jgi:hypothetical protein
MAQNLFSEDDDTGLDFDELEEITSSDDSALEVKFKPEHNNLDKDITYLDLQISGIQKHIILLESTVSSVEQALNNKSNPNVDRTKYFAVLNKTLELLALYHGNVQRFLDLKFKYRKEQGELKFKIVRMINIELESTKKNNNQYSDVLEVLKNFNFDDKSSTNKLIGEIEDVNNNPLYEL